MARYIVRRLLGLLPVLLGVALLVFAMLWIAPGDPVLALVGESAQGRSREALEELRRAYGLYRGVDGQVVDHVTLLAPGDLVPHLPTGQPMHDAVSLCSTLTQHALTS